MPHLFFLFYVIISRAPPSISANVWMGNIIREKSKKNLLNSSQILTLFGIKCQERRFPLRLFAVAVFSYISLAFESWLENVSVDADMLMLIMGLLHGDASGDGEKKPLWWSRSRMRRRFPGQRPFLPRSEQSHQPSRPSAFCSMTSNTSPFRNGSSSRVSAMLSKSARALTFCENWDSRDMCQLEKENIFYDRHMLIVSERSRQWCNFSWARLTEARRLSMWNFRVKRRISIIFYRLYWISSLVSFNIIEVQSDKEKIN